MVKTIDPNNVETRNSFDPAGNLTSVTDSLNQTTRYEYDSRNRVSRSIDPAGGVTQFKYDADDQLTSLTDSVGNTTRSQYDARGRVLRHTDPLGQNSVYEWNEVNNLMAMVDRNGRRTEFAYDDVDRRTSEHWVAGGNTISYAYNKASNLLTATDTFSGLAMAYDARNRVRTVNNAGTSGVPNVVLTYTYDATSNRLSTADTIGGASGGLNSYSYDALDRVTRVAQSGSNVSNKRVDMTYNSLGQFSSIQRFKDLGGTQLVVGTNYTYDSLNRLTGLHHHNAASTDVSFFDFVYDTDSRITRITDIDGATDYSYNTRDELTGANHADVNNPDETYSYDANGNRITSSRHGSGYVTGANNRLLSDGTFNYSYDNEGNLTRRTEIATGKVRDFTWDYRNRLTAVIDKTAANVVTQRVAFTYDTFGRRISKAVDTTPLDAVDAVITHFVYDGQDVLLDFVDTDGSGPVAATLAQRYLYGPAVDQILAQDNGAGNVLWHLTDHMGTVRDLANSNGAVVNHLTYDSYGNVISQSNAAQGTRYGFTGRELDAETRLYYYRSRYYDPNIGRFINEDRIGFRGGDANLYSYVGNSPVAFSDPSGNKAGDFKGSGKIEKFKHGSGDAWDSEKGTLELANGETVEAFLNKEKNPGLAHNTDCHGYTFVDGKYWINSDQVEKILTGDRYKELYFGYGAKIGDVVVYRKWTLEKGWEVIHSVKVSGVSELGFPREVEGKGGVDDKIEKKPPIWLLNPFGGGWGDPRDLVTVRYYRK